MNSFWKDFDKLMGKLPKYIDKTIDDAMKDVDDMTDTSLFKTSKSVNIINGEKIVTVTKNGKMKTLVNGDRVVPKKYADDLLEELGKHMKHDSKAVERYKKYLEKQL